VNLVVTLLTIGIRDLQRPCCDIRWSPRNICPLSDTSYQQSVLVLWLTVIFYRAMLCIRGTSHGPVSVCPSVCPSVTSRCSTKMAKRRITKTTPHDSPVTLVFLTLKISAKFDRGHPLRGRRMQVGWVKIGDFWPIAGYISKTVQDRHIVSIKVE